ncbi:hypothetical protein [Verrucomicrobium sp. BvORR034]|jgi:hypothetical protein|uniref:hypothetical protein n=1 Tax=Verrucomicrobium sp. BvORR034 TaxID=1396418 RepID=UPI0006796DB2|nr:hypothetical protein [Verrucomicrobium sp. BvORR034]
MKIKLFIPMVQGTHFRFLAKGLLVTAGLMAFAVTSAFADSDTDGDGINDDIDPYPEDSSNYSSANAVSWYGDVLGDADGDSIPNYQDSSPYPQDSDGDGLSDSVDPAPNDPYNFSGVNSTTWYGDANGDSDGDGISNFSDSYPYDYWNGWGDPNVDSDSDGLIDNQDPAPYDQSNWSPWNSLTWPGSSVNGDADSDGIYNFWDYSPYPEP